MSDERTNIRRSILASSMFPRKLKVYFYTSNTEKLLQARLLFQREGQTLNHFRATREPYEEDYSLSKEDLLRRAISQVRNEFLVRSVFFVEDTSIRIDAFSSEEDVPGLRAKEWFSSTSFEQIDEQLKGAGNNRRATVKSDIALHIPNLEETFLFHGETSGEVATVKPVFEANAQYPWLTPETFNGWFIPSGASVPLGAMTLDDSLDFDFRAKSLSKVLAFLRPLNAAANLPSSFFSRHVGRSQGDKLEPYLPHIFEPSGQEGHVVVCIIGHKCSGKTTASEFVQSNFGASFFEASDQLKATAGDFGIEITSSSAAMRFLEEHGQDAVAQQILDQLTDDRATLVVISGLRTVEELDLIYQAYPNAITVQIVADRRIRYERHIRRGRDTSVKTAEQFGRLDRDQFSFGLLQVADEVADVRIVNEGDLAGFYSRVNGAVRDAIAQRGYARRASYSNLSELHRCLLALDSLDQVSRCEEISTRTGELGGLVWRYNTNRALKSVPLFVDRYDKGEDLLSYSINSRGKRLLRLLNSCKGYSA